MSPPLKIDQLSISPTNTETLLIQKGTGGNLLFTDESISGGITLKKLSGISMDNLISVGVGNGSDFTSIQDAIDEAPTTSTAANPTLILIYSGTYSENIVIDKDGLVFIGVGRVILNAANDDDTVLIQEGVSTIPLISYFENISFGNEYDGRACFRVLGENGTTLGLNGIKLSNCSFVGTGLGTYCVRAHLLNSLTIQDCDCIGSVISTTITVSQCADLQVNNLMNGPDLALSYNNTLDIPSVATSSYSVRNSNLGNLTTVLTGLGELDMERLTTANVTVDGNRAYTMLDCYSAILQVNGTVTVDSKGSRYTSISGSPTAVLDIDNLQDSVNFTAEATKIVTFSVPTSNTNYMILTSHPFVGEKEGVTKTTTGFTIDFSSPQTGTVDYLIRR